MSKGVFSPKRFLLFASIMVVVLIVLVLLLFTPWAQTGPDCTLCMPGRMCPKIHPCSELFLNGATRMIMAALVVYFFVFVMVWVRNPTEKDTK